ncbi:type I secretion system permease/ATPase [Erwinia sp. HR93]|uniref:type I secretion system permease/ATPase n=1 Tax=Erwinia sp. HR93 TaxID=3094840 RepID=UPI002ADECE21|nr:type I secretion system permease/ATPase [Erwinia sp. HR93]MEA1063905.1 type I secretion system permease/ATPase [Erwinia sp. HR93]
MKVNNENNGPGEIFSAIRACKKELWSIALFSAITNLLMLTPSIYMLQVYDRVLASGNKITLVMLTVIVIWLFIFLGGLEWLRSVIASRMGNQLDMRINRRIFYAVFEGYRSRSVQYAAQGMSDLTQLRQFSSGNAVFAFFDAPWFFLYLLTIFLLHFWLGIMALVGAIVLLFLAWLNQKITTQAVKRAGELSAEASRQVNATLSQSGVIDAMGMHDAFYQRWLQQHRDFLHQQNQVGERGAAVSTATRMLRLTLQSLMLGMGAWLVLLEEITPGMMIAGSILSGRVMAPIDQIIAIWRPWIQTRQSWQRLESLLASAPLSPSRLPLPPPTGYLKCEHLSHREGIHSLLRDISFELVPGDILGIIGPSGAGKSTLAAALVGALAPTGGKIRLDGAELPHWDKNILGSYIGYLPQDIQLFQGTIAENIARFSINDESKIVAAARCAGVHELILQLPLGYDTPLGERGHPLSGGQKQRVALARAIYNTPVLLVMDEPDASLDDGGRAALISAIMAQKNAGSTQIIVTHGSALLACATKLLVLNNGQVNYFGSAQALRQGKVPNERQRQPAVRDDAVAI